MSHAQDSIRVLHVDDEPEFAEMAGTFVEREDARVEVEPAVSAREGLDALSGRSFDGVVSDYDMPEIDGIEFLEQVRERWPDLPFVLFTGKGSEEVASEAISRGATDYLQKRGGTQQYALLANRVLNAVEQYRSQQYAAQLDRLRTLASDVNRALVRSDSRAEAERRVCETISESEPYLFAWFGEVDEETKRITSRASAGIGTDYLEAIRVTADESETGRGPAGTAARERRVVVSQNVFEDPAFEPWRSAATERGFRAVAGVPIEHVESFYGVLVVYAAEPDAFDVDERALLAELGDDVAQCLHSFEIHERLRTERDRREALFGNAPGPVIETVIHENENNHVITGVNEAFEEVFGYEEGVVVGRNVADVVVPEGGRAAFEAVRDRSTRGETVVTDVERLTADGPRDFFLHTIPYGTDADHTLGVYAWYTDITERKAYERAIDGLHDTAHAIMRAETPAAVADLVVESARDILRVPASSVHLYDERTDRLEPVRWADRIESIVGDVPAFERGEGIAWAVFETGETRTVDDVSTDPQRLEADTAVGSETIVPMGEHGTLIVSSEEKAAFGETDVSLLETLALHATTALDRIERQRELESRNERLAEFANVVSHDLRNPLTVAQGRLELARDGREDDEDLAAISRALDRSQAMIDDLLGETRDGEVTPDLEPVALADAAERAWGHVQTREATLAVTATRSIGADPTRLARLLENLFRNAVEHGGADVSVTVADREGGFSVADDGPGIPAEARARVFDSGFSMAPGGTGFGLEIVERVVEAHGWSIDVAESEDGGARFDVTGVEFVD